MFHVLATLFCRYKIHKIIILTPHLAMIQKETLCNDWAFQATTAQDSKHAVTIDNYHAEIMVETT